MPYQAQAIGKATRKISKIRRLTPRRAKSALYQTKRIINAAKSLAFGRGKKFFVTKYNADRIEAKKAAGYSTVHPFSYKDYLLNQKAKGEAAPMEN